MLELSLNSLKKTSHSIQQVPPQAAKTMSPPFARMGGFGGGSSNSFDQMPTGASPTTTSGANYPPMNVRASLNTNGYGKSFGNTATVLRTVRFLDECFLFPDENETIAIYKFIHKDRDNDIVLTY